MYIFTHATPKVKLSKWQKSEVIFFFAIPNAVSNQANASMMEILTLKILNFLPNFKLLLRNSSVVSEIPITSQISHLDSSEQRLAKIQRKSFIICKWDIRNGEGGTQHSPRLLFFSFRPVFHLLLIIFLRSS